MSTRQELQLGNEEKYVEEVDYHMRILTLLTEEEVDLLHECWNHIYKSEGFLSLVFLRMFSQNESFKEPFTNLHGHDDVILSHTLKRHNEEVRKSMNSVVENITQPDTWMEEFLQISTLHRIYGVKRKYLKSFRNAILDTLKESLGEEMSGEMEEVCGRVLDCIVAFMNQSVAKNKHT